MKRIIMILGIAGLLTACTSGEKKVQNEEFKYLVDEFADLKVKFEAVWRLQKSPAHC